MKHLKRILLGIVAAFVIIMVIAINSKPKYETSVLWGDSTPLMCACEIDDYTGHKLQAGDYTISPIGYGSYKTGETPATYEIYVSSVKHENVSEMSNSEFVCYVGGGTADACAATLKKGDYIYIVKDSVVGTPVGSVKLEIKK